MGTKKCMNEVRIAADKKRREEKKVFIDSIKPTFYSLENDICMMLGLDINLFKSRYHKREYADGRAMLFAIMRPLTKDVIGLKLLGGIHRKGYDHSTLKTALKKHEDLYGSDKRYTQMFDLLK
jgi:hypothetical protein